MTAMQELQNICSQGRLWGFMNLPSFLMRIILDKKETHDQLRIVDKIIMFERKCLIFVSVIDKYLSYQ